MLKYCIQDSRPVASYSHFPSLLMTAKISYHYLEIKIKHYTYHFVPHGKLVACLGCSRSFTRGTLGILILLAKLPPPWTLATKLRPGSLRGDAA